MGKILLLDNYDSFTYNLYAYMKQSTSETIEVHRNDSISLNEVHPYETIVLSPGPGIPSEAGILIDLIKTYAPTKKILGVCLGLQAIGEAFGGNLKNLETVFHGVSTNVSIETNHILFKGLPNTLEVGRYHSWILDEKNLPAELIVTSRDKQNQIMSIKHETYHVHGVQFHPESIMTKHGHQIIDNFLNH